MNRHMLLIIYLLTSNQQLNLEAFTVQVHAIYSKSLNIWMGEASTVLVVVH